MIEVLDKAGLTDKQLACLSAYFYDCEGQPEIATRLGVSQPMVHKHISAGIKKLRAAGLPTPKRVKHPRPLMLSNMDIDRLTDTEVRAVL